MAGRMMWLLLLLGLCMASHISAIKHQDIDTEDNDFAEFEDFEDDIMTEDAVEDDPGPSNTYADVESADDADANVEDEDDEFDILDEDEFEGFDTDRPTGKSKSQEKPPDLKITNIPVHLRTNWDSFYLEMLMLAGLGVYFLNFLAGKSKNSRLAQAWLSAHKQLLEQNFSVVGDDGTSTDVQSGVLMKESENIYSLWCSGRTICEGMLVTLKLLKRQDLVSTISRMFKPVSDQVIVKVTLDENELDTFVLCLANKKVCSKLQKDTADLNQYCPERKNVDRFGIPASFQLLSEIGEAANSLFDRQVVAALNKYESMIEYIHVSDQYSGPTQQDDNANMKQPDASKVMIFCFNVPDKGKTTVKDMESLKPLLQMVFYCMEKIRKIRLGREAKTKADKNRQRVMESYQKASHAQRQEAAQQRREEKRRNEKERIMNEDDPEKQRKWEERDNRREAKKKQPRVKMMKIKSM